MKIELKVKLYLKLLLFPLVLLLVVSCAKKPEPKNGYSVLEAQRKLFFEQYKSQISLNNKFLDSLYYELDYVVPDTLSAEAPITQYIRNNPELPKFIVRALVERRAVEFMTMGELFLAKPNLLQQLYHQKLIFAFPKKFPNQIYIGQPQYLIKSKGTFTAGKVYIFENGFLKFIGVI